MTTEVEKTKATDKSFDENRFEFKLTINDHIICQRTFDVYHFKKRNLKLEEVRPLMNTLAGTSIDSIGRMGLIPTYLKSKSEDYLWDNYKYYETQTPEMIDRRDVFEEEDIIGFEINFDGNLVARTAFSGNIFPPKVRYNIDIRGKYNDPGLIPQIISEIRKAFSA
jgi:hypothetical protein